MEASKPLVQRHSFDTEIDSKVLVMEIVEVVVGLQSFFPLGHKFVKTSVTQSRTDTCMHQVKYTVDWMRRDNPVEKHA